MFDIQKSFWSLTFVNSFGSVNLLIQRNI